MDSHDPTWTDSPPPLPSSLPPPLMGTASKNDYDGEEDDNDHDGVQIAGKEMELPAWVNNHLHLLAECPGCIAEQKLKHTCSHLHNAKHTTTTTVSSVSTLSHVHGTDTTHDKAKTADAGATDPEPEPVPQPAEAEETPKRNRNTWPRKRGRATMFHVAYIFDADDDNDNVEQIVVENGSNYFVSVDDSVCDRGRRAEEYSLSRAGSVERILRNSTQELPKELETVRKGTPLYGQPAWWGDDSSSKGDNPPVPETDTRDTTRSPSSSNSSSIQPQHHHPQHHQGDPQQGLKESSCLMTPLPNPATDTLTAVATQPKPAASKDPSSSSRSPVPVTVTAKNIPLTTHCPSDGPSLSATEFSGHCADTADPDSGVAPGLLGPPPPSEDSQKTPSPTQPSDSPSGAETAKIKADEGSRSSGHPVAMEVNSGPALSFTVEFGDEKKPKLKSGASLSEFVPPKLRHTLSSSYARPDKSAKGKETGGSCAISEEQETSPAKSSAVEDSSGCETENKARAMHRLSNGQFSGVTSSGAVTVEKSASERLDSTRKPQLQEKTAPPSTTLTTTTTTATTVTTRVNKLKSTNAMPTARYSDPTSYLIDRMFAGATRPAVLPDATSTEGSSGSDSPVVSDQASYKETIDRDRGLRKSGSSTYRCSSKPPLQKQKSLGKVLGGANTASEINNKTGADSPCGMEEEREGTVEPSGDNEDKVSDAGTYTIEGDEDREEEMLARQQIDEVFGVDLNTSFERPVIDGWEGVAITQRRERSLPEGRDSDSKGSTPRNKDTSGLTDYSKRRTLCGWDVKDEVAPWISQLTALTSASRRSSSSSKGTDRDEVTDKGQDDGSKKPPQGASNRRRPGTGRRLPSIPTGSDHSSAGSERSFRLRDLSPDSVASTLNGSIATRSDFDDGARVVESPVSSIRSGSRGSSCLKPSRLSCSPCGSEDSDRKVLRRPGLKNVSAMSRASLDSQLLLRKTNSVMEAMEIRMGFSSHSKAREEVTRSDADLTKALALMNGGEDRVSQGKDRAVQGEAQSKVSSSAKNSSNSKPISASSSKTSVTKTASEQKPPVTGVRNSRGGAGVSSASEMMTRHHSLDLDVRSDSREKLPEQLDRSVPGSESGAKGSLSIAKTNRAFTLRRARADSTETKETERGRANAASSRSSRRSTSLHGTARTTFSELRTTEQGGRNDRKMRGKSATRDRTPASRTRDRSMPRVEGTGQNSQQHRRTSSSSSLANSTTIASRAKEKERDVHTPKSQLRSSYKDLTINGFSRGSHSQPGSRSGSPKSAERMAWKRRKEYDPRKAVAEAKANKQKEVTSRGKPKAPSSQFKQRLTRSVSLTNTAELSLAPDAGGCDAVTVDSPASVQDLSSRTESSVQRGFIPFHNSLRAQRFSRSTDEEEGGHSPKSQDANNSFNTSLNSPSRKSAFTPPLSKLHPSSPDLSCSRRFVLVDVDFDDAGASALSAAAESTKSPSDSQRTGSTSPQTYNSLIVSSIYQLSHKLRNATDKTLGRLREEKRVTFTPSPDEDVLDEQRRGEIPAWKSANQELASVLRNMRRLEHHLHLIDQVLFPEDNTSSDLLGMSSTDKEKYLLEIERIRAELAGFQPIARPRPQPLELSEAASPEMAQLLF